MAAITVLFLLVSLLGLSTARPDGAPVEACTDLVPRGPHAPGSTTASPYILEVAGLVSQNGYYFYTPGETYNVTLRGGNMEQFRGFLVQLRSAADQSILSSQLTENSGDIKPHACMPATGGFTHTAATDKAYISFMWTPMAGAGDVVFRYTVVRVRDSHWDAATTGMLREDTQVCVNSTTVGPATVNWTARRASVSFSFQMPPSINGTFAALGFSNDRFMANSDIIVGAVDQAIGFVDDRWASARAMPPVDPMQSLTATSVALLNGYIVVNFTRLLNTNDSLNDIVLTNNEVNCVYFLVARGTANVTDRMLMQHSTANRAISMERVCLCSDVMATPTPTPTPTPSGAGWKATSLSVVVLLMMAAIHCIF